MARTFADSSQLPRPLVLISIGFLTKSIPLSVVESSLIKCNKQGLRKRLLPASFLVYFVICLSIYMGFSHEEVLRKVVEGFRFSKLFKKNVYDIATKGAISRARSRLGWEVMDTIFKSIVVPLAKPETRGCWYHNWRLMAIDGTTLSVPATEENIAAFGMHGSKEGPSAFPIIRMMALVETGTHAIVDAAFDECSKSEYIIAENLLPSLTPWMLLLEDRGFIGYDWWQKVRTTGAEVICRVRDNMKFRVDTQLPDGSFLSVLRPPNKSNGEPITVRVITYTIKGMPEKGKKYHVITSIINHEKYPAHELAALYHERWEIESIFDEFKTHIRGGARVVLRSQTPDMVKQELYGLLLAHYTVRTIMHESALLVDEDPDKISFTHTINVIRRKLPHGATIFPPERYITPDKRNNK
jgi:hypothetical protein